MRIVDDITLFNQSLNSTITVSQQLRDYGNFSDIMVYRIVKPADGDEKEHAFECASLPGHSAAIAYLIKNHLDSCCIVYDSNDLTTFINQLSKIRDEMVRCEESKNEES